MKTNILISVFLVYLCSFAIASDCKKTTSECTEKEIGKTPTEDTSTQIEQILSKMQNATKQLNSCQAKITYLTVQDPDLLDSRTTQSGILYYLKNDERSYLRIRFDDKKEDDFEPEEQREEYLFDGVWLTQIDYKLKQVNRYQKAYEDNPIDVFELISQQFPLIGFSKIDQLKKDFDVQFSEKSDESKSSIGFLLGVKKDSKYEKDYKKIDFWVSKSSFLPEKIVAYSSQGDIYDIQFNDFQVNKKLKKAVFTIETPSDFRKNIEPLEKSTEKGN